MGNFDGFLTIADYNEYKAAAIGGHVVRMAFRR
jgi:hypothetical protein